jgi:hypothetical protein
MTSKHSTALVAVLGIGCIFLTACKPRDAKPTESATSAPVATGSPSPAVIRTPSTAPDGGLADASPAPAESTKVAEATPPADGKPKRVEYAPGVLIDWSVPHVEITAEVVLRERNLELLLCAKGTKEHESILATAAPASKIYEALGLIGLEPGQPPAFDLATKTPVPAAGQRLAIEIHTAMDGGQRVDAAHEWMRVVESKTPMPAPHWVFCGSRKTNQQLAADGEGTLICVVDFDSALIGLADNHDANDATLWLETDTQRIPPLGTTCTVVIRALDEAPIELVLTPENFFKTKDRVLDALELDAIIRERIRHNPDQRVVLTEPPGDPNPFARLAAHAIVGSGIKREMLTLNLLPRPEKTPPPAEELQVPTSPAPTSPALPSPDREKPTAGDESPGPDDPAP